VAISSSTISGNTATNYGGGVFVQGGTVAISSCTISGNTAAFGGGVFVGGATNTVAISSCTISGNRAHDVSAHVQKFPHRPDGKLADELASTLACTTVADDPVNYSRCVPQRLEVPIALMGDSRVSHCLQGGGVYVQGGTVTFSSCTISGNQAYYVRAHAQSSHRPKGKVANVLASTHTLAQLRTFRSTTACTCHRDLENSPSPPHGRLTCCSLFAGRRCLCLGWHSGHLIVHHQWEPS
jgi:hypothetical protein